MNGLRLELNGDSDGCPKRIRTYMACALGLCVVTILCGAWGFPLLTCGVVAAVKGERNEIGAEIEKEVAERMKRLPLRRGMSKRPVLVCDGHVDPAVEADGFFSAIIQGRRLLGI